MKIYRKKSRYTAFVSGIPFTMKYIDAFLTEEDGQNISHKFGRRGNAFISEGEDITITFYLVPGFWLKNKKKLPGRMGTLLRSTQERALLKASQQRLTRAGARRQGNGSGSERLLWLSKELREAIPLEQCAALFGEKTFLSLETQTFLPGTVYFSPEWLEWIWQGQEACEELVMILPDYGYEELWEELEAEAVCAQAFLGERYGELNSLRLISRALERENACISAAEQIPYYAQIYQDTGLPVICAGGFPPRRQTSAPAQSSAPAQTFAPAHSRRRICVDFRPGSRIPFRSLPENSLYLDMTSDPDKERLLAVKRRDISYRSALNYLDTYVRKRYNTSRYKENCKADNG